MLQSKGVMADCKKQGHKQRDEQHKPLQTLVRWITFTTWEPTVAQQKLFVLDKPWCRKCAAKLLL